MTREERMAILGPEEVARIHRRVEAAPPPPEELIEDLRHMFAPALARRRAMQAAAFEHRAAA